MSWLFGKPIGVAVRASDQAPAQISLLQQKIAIQQLFNAYVDINNFLRTPNRYLPLDERFADFKRRLADAVDRNERRKV